jgi:hypothetical protein
MARKSRKSEHQGKIRTREHIIADLAINHVERQVLLCGYTVEKIVHDYGTDLLLFTFAPKGEVEHGLIFLQVKGTERLKPNQSGLFASFQVERANLHGWLLQVLPVILIVYDVSADRALWVHVQGYCQAISGFNLFEVGTKMRMRLPTSQLLTPDSVRYFSVLRDRSLQE